MNHSITSCLWTDKYKPQKISDIISNSKGVNMIIKWLHEFEIKQKKIKFNKKNNSVKIKRNKTDTKNNIRSCILITGNHGIGKTVAIEVILKHYNYTIQRLNLQNVKNNKNMSEVIKKKMKHSNIMYMINVDKKKSKTAIVIDEIESITSTTEKNYITSLQKLNEINWYCPIIFISNNQHNKLLAEIKKNSLNIKFWPPNNTEIITILSRIIKKEDINIKSYEIIDKIVTHTQYDIRRLINTLQDIKYAYNNKLITNKIINNYFQMSKMKDIDIDLFKATEGLLYDYKTIDNCIIYYETEKVLLSLMIHQNYLKNILENCPNQKDQFVVSKHISKALSTGDVIENYIYGDQNWDMQIIHGYYTCVIPSFYLNKCIKSDPTKIRLKFTTDLNKTSIKKINKKNINNTNKCFTNMNIFDYIYINKLIKNLINNGKIEECVKLLKDYNIKLEHIESLLKIDKIKNIKTSLTSKQKKEFQKYLK